MNQLQTSHEEIVLKGTSPEQCLNKFWKFVTWAGFGAGAELGNKIFNVRVGETVEMDNIGEQAGAELGQAQPKLILDCN